MERYAVGVPVEGRLAMVELRFKGKVFLPPVAVEVVDTPPRGLEVVGSPAVRGVLGWGVEYRADYKVVARAGRREFGEASIRVMDLLGLYSATMTFTPRGDGFLRGRPLAVEPELPPEREGLVASLAARASERQGLEFYSVREYVEGDDPRMIDWKATARLSRLIVKELRDEAGSPVIILLAPGEGGDDGEPGDTPFESLARAVAGIAVIASSYSHPVGYIGFSGELVITPPQPGPRGLHGVLDGLADTPPSSAPPRDPGPVILEYLSEYVRVRPYFVLAAPEELIGDLVAAVESLGIDRGPAALLLVYSGGRVRAEWRRSKQRG